MIAGVNPRNDKKLVLGTFVICPVYFDPKSSGPKFESPYYYPDITFESMWKRSGGGWNQEMEDLNPLIF